MSTDYSPCFDESLAHVGRVELDVGARPGAREVMIARMSEADTELCVELEPAEGDAFSAQILRNEAELRELREGDIVFVAARSH